MRTIYRYAISHISNEITFPRLKDVTGSFLDPKEQIVKVAMIRDIPSVWVMVDDDAPDVSVCVSVCGTGWDATKAEREQYIGSYIVAESEIYHAFVTDAKV